MIWLVAGFVLGVVALVALISIDIALGRLNRLLQKLVVGQTSFHEGWSSNNRLLWAYLERFEKAFLPSRDEEHEVSVVLTGHCDHPDAMSERVHDKAGFLSHSGKTVTFRGRDPLAIADIPVRVIRPEDLLYIEVHGPAVMLGVRINGIDATPMESVEAKRLSLLGWKLDAAGVCTVRVRFVPPKARLGC